jgi:hypothetical protein
MKVESPIRTGVVRWLAETEPARSLVLEGGGRGQSHNSNILTRVSLEHSATACVGPHGDAMGMEHEKYGATQAIFGYG